MGAVYEAVEGTVMRTHRAKRNGPCLCGSGEKFKRCCLPKAKVTPDCPMFRWGPTEVVSFSGVDRMKYRECGSCKYIKPDGKCKTGVR